MARETGHRRAQAAALHGLAAGACYLRGCFEPALAADAEARRIAVEEGRTEWLIYPLITTALIYQVTGQSQLAHATLDELAALTPAGSVAQGCHLCLCAELALDEGETEVARRLLFRVRPIAEASGEPELNFALRLGMSRYHRLLGHGPEAHEWADDALRFVQRLGCRYDQVRALIERGQAAWLCSDLTGAERDLRAAIELSERMEAAFELGRSRFLLAALLHEQGRPETADA